MNLKRKHREIKHVSGAPTQTGDTEKRACNRRTREGNTNKYSTVIHIRMDHHREYCTSTQFRMDNNREYCISIQLEIDTIQTEHDSSEIIMTGQGQDFVRRQHDATELSSRIRQLRCSNFCFHLLPFVGSSLMHPSTSLSPPRSAPPTAMKLCNAANVGTSPLFSTIPQASRLLPRPDQ